MIDGAGNDFYFPVNPDEISISRGKALETVNILSLGEYDFPAGEKVKEVAFSSFFPAVYDPGYCNYENLPDPQEAMNQLTTMMNGKSPVRLIISGTAVNVLVTIAAHNSSFKGGEPGDVYFDLTARTWREMKVHTAASAAGGRPKNQPVRIRKSRRKPTSSNPETRCPKSLNWSSATARSGSRFTKRIRKRSARTRTKSSPVKSW